jgi:hypothetical protein
MRDQQHSLLATFQALSDEEKRHRAQRIQLPRPCELEAEQQIMESLLQEHQVTATSSLAESFEKLLLLVQQPAIWAPACLFVCITTAWMWTSKRTLPIKKTVVQPHRLIPKGQGTQQTPSLTLQLGKWNNQTQSIRVLQPEQSVSTNDSLVFGFKLEKHRGHIHLFHIRPRGAEHIYPPPDAKSTTRKPSQKVQLLQGNGTPQKYSLTTENGKQQFLMLVTKRPLSITQQQTWIHAYNQSKSIAQSLQTAALKQTLLTHGSFTLYVKEPKP